MKAALFAILRALGWAVVLPLFGFSVFTLLTIVPLLGVLAGPVLLLKTIMAAGFVPSLCTALVFEFLLRERSPRSSFVLTVACGIVCAGAWYTWWGAGSKFGLNYVTGALAVATAASVALMPLITFAYRAKIAREEGLTP